MGGWKLEHMKSTRRYKDYIIGYVFKNGQRYVFNKIGKLLEITSSPEQAIQYIDFRISYYGK